MKEKKTDYFGLILAVYLAVAVLCVLTASTPMALLIALVSTFVLHLFTYHLSERSGTEGIEDLWEPQRTVNRLFLGMEAVMLLVDTWIRLPPWLVGFTAVFLSGIPVLCVLAAIKGEKRIARKDEILKERADFHSALQSDVRELVKNEQDVEIRAQLSALYAKILYADPHEGSETAALEQEITQAAEALKEEKNRTPEKIAMVSALLDRRGEVLRGLTDRKTESREKH